MLSSGTTPAWIPGPTTMGWRQLCGRMRRIHGHRLIGTLISLTGTLMLTVGCQSPGARPLHPPTSPSTGPPVTPVWQAADLALTDGEVGLTLVERQDHLSLAEAVGQDPDQAQALDRYQSWGWIEASRRRWAGGNRQFEATVLVTLRPSSAAGGFHAWSLDAVASPYAAVRCPASVQGLDECVAAASGSAGRVIGRLGAVVFKLSGDQVDLARLAALQAAHLNRPNLCLTPDALC